jgi:hypothetical protein
VQYQKCGRDSIVDDSGNAVDRPLLAEGVSKRSLTPLEQKIGFREWPVTA